jgi:hypothetical protein
MNFEHLWLLFLVALPVLWMMLNSHRGYGFNPLLINTLGAALLLAAFSLSGFVLRESKGSVNALANGLNALSAAELRMYSGFLKRPCWG